MTVSLNLRSFLRCFAIRLNDIFRYPKFSRTITNTVYLGGLSSTNISRNLRYHLQSTLQHAQFCLINRHALHEAHLADSYLAQSPSLQRGKTSTPKMCPGYDIKPSDGEAPGMEL